MAKLGYRYGYYDNNRLYGMYRSSVPEYLINRRNICWAQAILLAKGSIKFLGLCNLARARSLNTHFVAMYWRHRSLNCLSSEFQLHKCNSTFRKLSLVFSFPQSQNLAFGVSIAQVQVHVSQVEFTILVLTVTKVRYGFSNS